MSHDSPSGTVINALAGLQESMKESNKEKQWALP